MDVAFEVGKQREPAALLFAVDGSERDEGVVVVIDKEHDDESDDDVDRVVTTTGQKSVRSKNTNDARGGSKHDGAAWRI